MRRAVLALLIVAVFVALYAVSRHSTTVTSTTVATSTTSTTSATAAAATCHALDFSGVYNEGEGAAGTVYASITLTKSTPGSCTLEGWPILTLQDKLGAVLPLDQINVPANGNDFTFLTPRANVAPTTQNLTANDSVTFSLAYSDVPTSARACASAMTVNVQLVSQGASIAVTPAYAVSPCNNGQVWVSPFY